MAFTHLHLHTQYSLLDGDAVIGKVVARAKELGMDSLAITDHGAMYGVIDFYRECRKQGIKPVIGCEVYTAARSHLEKDADRDRQMHHLLLLAENNEGYRNLIKIVSIGFTEGFYYKPRIDKDVLRRYNKGIIATSACLAGDVQQHLLLRDYEGAKKEALEYLDIFGEGNFFLELQDQGLDEEARIFPDMMKLHEETGIPFIATNDVHYVKREDAKVHDVLLCIQTASTIDEENRMRFPNDQFYLKSEDEMRSLFAGVPEAIENTHKIAERCNVEFEFGKLHLPEFIPPEGMDNKTYLRNLCESGFADRYPEADQALRNRLEYELSTIENMGYVEYFLIVWDFINYAKSNDIMVGPGRGSAAGSIVSYCLRITDIDPIKYNLIFERFLNPERVSMPDIDVDFCYERRHEVIEYVQRKYGADHVAQIVTFGTMKAKLAVRDVGRVMNVSYGETDAIAKAIPNQLGMTIDKALQMNPELKLKYQQDAGARKLIDVSRALEGMPRHASTHAAGVVITRDPVDEYVPLTLTEKGPATQFSMTTIEELGLLKMDFLGLRNLTIIRDALEMIKANHGVSIDFSKMEYDDSEVYEMISQGNTDGVFQLESDGMKSFMKNLRPDCFEDIIAGIALYRPGPMASIPTYIDNKKHPGHISYIDPSLEPILSVTYGCMVYQEQVMQIVRDLAGYSFGRSDLVRRAMSKKKMEVMLQEKEVFIHGQLGENGEAVIPGAVRNGVPEAAAEEIYNQMVSFASYAFNKSHAAAYAVIGYETGFLKVHYPAEFMAALMSNVMGDSSQISGYIRNCTDMGIEVLPPDVNTCGRKFTVVDGKIRFGLQAIKNVGEGVIDAIIEARETKGIPHDLFEFIDGLDVHKINKSAVESLIKSGATASLEGNRAQQLSIYAQLIESAQNDSRKNIAGQLSLFQTNADAMDTDAARAKLPQTGEFDKKTLSAMEKEMLGVYITDHPLKEYEQTLKKIVTVTSAQLTAAADKEDETAEAENPGRQLYDGQNVTAAGIISGKRTLITKSNKMMAFVQMEDLYGEAEVIVFPNIYEQCSTLIKEDAVIVVEGRLNFKEDETPKIIAQTVRPIEQITDSGSVKPIKFRIPDDADTETVLGSLTEIMKRHRGSIPVLIYVPGRKVMRASESMRVDGGAELIAAAQELLGYGNVKTE